MCCLHSLSPDSSRDEGEHSKHQPHRCCHNHCHIDYCVSRLSVLMPATAWDAALSARLTVEHVRAVQRAVTTDSRLCCVQIVLCMYV